MLLTPGTTTPTDIANPEMARYNGVMLSTVEVIEMFFSKITRKIPQVNATMVYKR